MITILIMLLILFDLAKLVIILFVFLFIGVLSLLDYKYVILTESNTRSSSLTSLQYG